MSVPGRYLELGLRVGRLVPGYVDAYYGPAELKDRVEAEPLRDPVALASDAQELLADIEATAFEPQRKRWLAAQGRALETVAQRLAGAELGYVEEVERCYGIVPRRASESDFAEAHRVLDDALGGDGSVAARYADWLEQSVPPDRQGELIESISSELRARVRESFGLPDGETVEYGVVANEPWIGFNYYEGRLRSRVVINTDVPLPRSDFGRFVAHESYPGHHTERATKEALLVDERGQLEQSISLAGAPEAILSEGIAESGFKVLAPDLHELTSEHLARIGIDYDAEVGRSVGEARDVLAEVGVNVALMLHEDGVPESEARAYARQWSLQSGARLDKLFAFVTDPVWRTYVPSYTEGERLCSAFVGGDPARFERLLTEQLTPADLAA